ncbi:MAG: LemA family protein [Nitrospirota bacterium]|nr:LemA family protein [Nitrospirota bacterium]
MKKWLVLATAVIGITLFVLTTMLYLALNARNALVKLDEGAKSSWAQVENQLQRRSDLIPNLVETAKGYAAHEKEIFEHVADARAKLAGAGTVPDKIAAANEVSSALSRLLVVVENYPNLKADQTFARLMDELAGTENRLSVERMRYNLAIEDYNRKVRFFPSNLVADYFGFKERVYFKAPEEAKQAPKVDFGSK